MYINLQESPNDNIKRNTSRTGIMMEFTKLSLEPSTSCYGDQRDRHSKGCSNMQKGYNLHIFIFLHICTDNLHVFTMPTRIRNPANDSESQVWLWVLHIAPRSLGRSGHRIRMPVSEQSHSWHWPSVLWTPVFILLHLSAFWLRRVSVSTSAQWEVGVGAVYASFPSGSIPPQPRLLLYHCKHEHSFPLHHSHSLPAKENGLKGKQIYLLQTWKLKTESLREKSHVPVLLWTKDHYVCLLGARQASL